MVRGYNFALTVPSGGESLVVTQLLPASPLEAVSIARRGLAVPFPWCFVHGREQRVEPAAPKRTQEGASG